MLTIWSQEAMASSAYDGMILSDLETGVREYHDKLREIIPVMGLKAPPPPGQVAGINAGMAEGAE